MPLTWRHAVLELIETYLSELKADPEYSLRTHEQYRSKLNQFARWCALDPAARPFERATVATYLKERQATVSPKTLKVTLSSIRTFATWAGAAGASELPDLREMRLPKAGEGYRRKPSDAEIKRLYAAADGLPEFNEPLRIRRYKTRAIIVLLCECGLRSGELQALNVADVIQRTGLQADGTPEDWLIRVRNGKGGSWDELPVDEETRPWLAEWLQVRAEWAGQRKMHSPAKEALFPVSKSRRMAWRALKRLWDELLAHAGLSDSELQRHAMRHWFGTTVAAREDLKTAQKMLRHSSIVTTERYLYTDDTKKKRAAKAVSEVIRGAAATRSAEPRPVTGSQSARVVPGSRRSAGDRGRFQRHSARAA